MIRPGTRKAIRGMAHNASRVRKPKSGCWPLVLVGLLAGHALIGFGVWELIT